MQPDQCASLWRDATHPVKYRGHRHKNCVMYITVFVARMYRYGGGEGQVPARCHRHCMCIVYILNLRYQGPRHYCLDHSGTVRIMMLTTCTVVECVVCPVPRYVERRRSTAFSALCIMMHTNCCLVLQGLWHSPRTLQFLRTRGLSHRENAASRDTFCIVMPTTCIITQCALPGTPVRGGTKGCRIRSITY